MGNRAVGRHAAGQRQDYTDGVRRLFDAKAARWPARYAPEGPLAGRLAQFAEAVRDRISDGGELLDLGCGSGELARHLAGTGYRMTGCDIAPEMLRQAEMADQVQGVRWIRLDPGWHTLPFTSGSLDAVIAASVLEYVPEPRAVLRECARVLRPGGSLLCTVPDLTHPVRWLEWPLTLVARTPLALPARHAWPRLGSYLTYLRISRQRRRIRWWQDTARHSGLTPALPPDGHAPRAPLRLLAFTRPGDATVPAQHHGDASDHDDHH
jgi:SAM-dependent methyltransferase